MQFSGFLAPIALFGLFLALAVAGFVFFELKTVNQDNKVKVTLRGEIFAVEVARSPAGQREGLSGRPSLGANEGMLFIFKNAGQQSFWMKDMLIPIDIIWIKENKIIGFEKNAQPEPGVRTANLKIYSPPELVDKVLEVPAGTVERLGIQVGDEVSVSYN